MNREKALLKILDELGLRKKIGTQIMGNIADILDDYAESEVKKISVNLSVSGSLPPSVDARHFKSKVSELIKGFASEELPIEEKNAMEWIAAMVYLEYDVRRRQ